MKKNDVLTIPNLLSVIRLIMIPFICILYIRGDFVDSVILIIISGLTDMLDGMIARKFNQISTLGKILDPLADKLTMIAVFCSIMLLHKPVILVFIVLVVKELIMLLGAFILFRTGKRPSESKIMGKIATTMLYVMLFIIVFADVITQFTHNAFFIPDAVMWIMAIICCCAAILALVQYFPIFFAIRSGKYNIETEKFEGENK